MKQATSRGDCCLLQAGILLGILFDIKDGGDMFLRNVGLLSTDYTELYSETIELFVATVVKNNTASSRRSVYELSKCFGRRERQVKGAQREAQS
jgi:hypothetical protein